MVNCVEIYRTSANGHELRIMELAYADRLPSDLEGAKGMTAEQKLVQLAQLTKRFLRDLPEPVVPASMYQDTINLVSGSTEPGMCLSFLSMCTP